MREGEREKERVEIRRRGYDRSKCQGKAGTTQSKGSYLSSQNERGGVREVMCVTFMI